MNKQPLIAAALSLSALFVSFNTQAHSHAHPQSEKAIQASKGIFNDVDVKDRKLSDWDGIWESIYPLLITGKLDPVLEHKAKTIKTKPSMSIALIIKKVIKRTLRISVLRITLLNLPRMVKSAVVNTTIPVLKSSIILPVKKGFVIYSNAKTNTQKHRNISNLVTILLNRRPQGIFTSIWGMNPTKNYYNKWIIGQLITPIRLMMNKLSMKCCIINHH